MVTGLTPSFTDDYLEFQRVALGNALVAPVIAYVPEGGVSPPTEHMRFPGTITIPDETFEKVLDFHVRTGAPAISWPHHKGESLSLTIPERKRFAEATVKVVAGRVPVTIHVSALAVEDTMELAQQLVGVTMQERGVSRQFVGSGCDEVPIARIRAFVDEFRGATITQLNLPNV